MNMTHTALLTLCLTLTIVAAQPALADPVPAEAHGLAVFVIDDQTGEELVTLHGIQPLTTSDLDVLLNGVLQNKLPVRLLHQAVDEDATDNPIAQMEFRPYSGGIPPVAPSPGLPLRVLTEKMKKWREDRAAWQQGIIQYRKKVVSEVEGFLRQVAATQLEVADRFDKMLAERNGRDFNRSDLFGCIVAANRSLDTKCRRVLVLNTDGVDLPGKRTPRTQALTDAELDPSIELIFVNTSRLPEQAPLFKGVKNPTRHADSMHEAMEMLVEMLGPDGAKKEAITSK